MDVLCADKTGTLTQNALTVTTVRPMPGFDEAHVLALAALASSDGGAGPGRWRHSRRGRKQGGLRRTEADQIRRLRSGQEDVRGDRNGCRQETRSES